MFVTDNTILDAKEVGDMLRITARTVIRLAIKGELPGFRVGGSWRFRKEAIEEYIRREEQRYKSQQNGEKAL